MQTVDKAFELLGLFSEREAELGLSEMARRADFDKATTRRLLLAMAKHGLIEQNLESRRYRIGPAVLRLAQVREATSPLRQIVQPILKKLVEDTGETAHFTLLSGHELATIAVQESGHSNRVTMAPGDKLPLHATASGLAVLAFHQSADLFPVGQRQRFTKNTPLTRKDIGRILRHTRESGYCINRGFYEADVYSIAAPVFDQSSAPIGAIAVAAPGSRFSEDQMSEIQSSVTVAAAEICRRIGGRAPAFLAA